MNKLRLMSIFVEVVECGSISKAAEKLELSKSVISLALKQLEQELQLCLLKRTTRKQTLTTAGSHFYLQCAQMTQQAEAAWLEASEFTQIPSGTLTVTAPHALMRSIVVPALTMTFNDYAKINLNFISDDEHVDIIQQNIDLAVRVGTSKDSNLKQRKVGQFCDVLCHAKTMTLDIQSAPYIAQHWQIEPVIQQLFYKQQVKYQIKHRANTLFDVVSLLEMGLGVGVIPDFILKQNRHLQAATDALPSMANPIYVLHPYQTHVPLTVTLAIAAIENKINQIVMNQ
ncbi:LysR family transcriptional regulator [uncultured Photobacterium sp.]|uniref:LysR family transcriptional regulator n=1 Tax=uncultured Photobacterium sp. TaxID=173973 RepID=UPI0026037B52|nr:LysR family transcriptional regulator [uncultured Photobacterium sp.]